MDRKLAYAWTFYFLQTKPGTFKSIQPDNYEQNIKQICTFHTVNEFWRVYSHLKRPSDLICNTDYQLFKNGIRPAWEDQANACGGKWVVRLRKGISNRIWEKLICLIIGESAEAVSDVCGIVLSVRFHEDILSVWNGNAEDVERCLWLRDFIKEAIQLPQGCAIEYKPHKVSMNMTHQQQIENKQ